MDSNAWRNSTPASIKLQTVLCDYFAQIQLQFCNIQKFSYVSKDLKYSTFILP